MKMSEINEIAQKISEHVDSSAKIIFGTYFDRKINKGQIKVTLIAAGFTNILLKERFISNVFTSNDEIAAAAVHLPFVKEEKQSKVDKESKEIKKEGKKIHLEIKNEEEEREKEWEIPAFLRRKRK